MSIRSLLPSPGSRVCVCSVKCTMYGPSWLDSAGLSTTLQSCTVTCTPDSDTASRPFGTTPARAPRRSATPFVSSPDMLRRSDWALYSGCPASALIHRGLLISLLPPGRTPRSRDLGVVVMFSGKEPQRGNPRREQRERAGSLCTAGGLPLQQDRARTGVDVEPLAGLQAHVEPQLVRLAI